jgi:hypothetical protein
MSFGIGYFTVEDYRKRGDFLDTLWVDSLPAASETEHLRHIAFDKPIRIAIDGRKNLGVIMKPSA